MALIVEIVSRSGRVLERHVVAGHSATIGRAYDNDIIVSDPYMEPNHARVYRRGDVLGVIPIDPDGRIVQGRRLRRESFEVESGGSATFGRTRVRLVSPDHPVGPSVALGFVDELFARLSRPVPVALGVLAFIGLAALNGRLNSIATIKVTAFVVGMAEPLVVVLVLATFWAIVGRIFRHEPRFFHHAWAALMYLSFLILTTWIVRWVTFNTNSLELNWWLHSIRLALGFFLLLSLNLRFAVQLSDWVRRGFAGGLALLWIVYVVLTDYVGAPDFQANPAFAKEMLPEAVLFRSGVEIDQYVDTAQFVFEFDEAAGDR